MTSPASDLLVDADWLHRNLDRPDVRVFDSTIRIWSDDTGREHITPGLDDYREAHVPKAGFIDLQEGFSAPDGRYPFTAPSPALFEQALRRLGINGTDLVVVYSSGNPWWATRLWWLFRLHGLRNIRLLDGGLRNWRLSGLPVESGEPPEVAAPGDISVGTPLPLVVGAEQLLGKLGDPSLRLVNALSPDRFSGRTPVHGGRPGHIPGSVNLPAGSLLDPQTHCLLPAARLRGILQEKGLLDPDKEVVAYCGGGISATLILFALALLDRPAGKLYDASLYEWGHRPDLPMETGAGEAPSD